MPKGLVTQLQGKQQLCILLLFESLVGQCEYTTYPKGSFWCQCVDAKSLLELFYGNSNIERKEPSKHKPSQVKVRLLEFV